MTSVFDLCRPRDDIFSGSVSDYAADLRKVLVGQAEPEYADAARFFENTHPTRGLKHLLDSVARRLSGKGGDSVFRLDTAFGGGKTHGMIALAHLAQSPQSVPAEFLEQSLRPDGSTVVAAFDGEMANVVKGVELEKGLFAKTPWGYLAYSLGGRDGFNRIRENDEQFSAPGSDDWERIIGARSALIMLDEMAVWLVKARDQSKMQQLAPFLQSLMKAVSANSRAALVISLAIGKTGRAVDAYAQQNIFLNQALEDATKIAGRVATIIVPTLEDETAPVLIRRLFAQVDRHEAERVVDAYARIWEAQRAHLPEDAFGPDRRQAFVGCYPFHPDLIETLNAKTSTFEKFQRVRGMLRLIAPTVRTLWERRPSDAMAIHLHHIDLGDQAIRTEFTTRLDQQAFDSAISFDIANSDPLQPALAQRLDDRYFAGMPPFATYVARTIFVNSIAFNQELRGLTTEQLRAAMLSPGFPGAETEGGAAFIEEARKRFIEESGYLDDRTTTVLRFAAEANLTRLIDQYKGQIDKGRVRDTLKQEIRVLFGRRSEARDKKNLALVAYPGSPNDIPDDDNDGQPYLALINYEAFAVDGEVTSVPSLVAHLIQYKGGDGTLLRLNRNNVIFLVADGGRVADMEDKIARRLALELLKERAPTTLAEHQQQRVQAELEKSQHSAAVAIQQCYRHLFYADSNALDPQTGLAHQPIEAESAAAEPGAGQRAIVRALRDYGKLVEASDLPVNPTVIQARTQLGTKGVMTASELREEFRRNRMLPILLGDEPLIAAIRSGIEGGKFVYAKGEAVYAKSLPPLNIEVSSNAMVYTAAEAADRGVYPKAEPATIALGPRNGPGQSADAGAQAKPLRPAIAPAGAHVLVAEGPLREAMALIKEQARSLNLANVRSLKLRSTSADSASKLARTVRFDNATIKVEAKMSYSTADESNCAITFDGSAKEAAFATDFFLQQARAAADQDADVSVTIEFDKPVSLESQELTKLVSALEAVAPGLVQIEAQA